MASSVSPEGVLAGDGPRLPYFRRRTTRVEAGEGVYAFWSCDGREGLARVHDLSTGGLFIESPVEQALGAPVKLDFLADEGQIRANAVVRHTKPGKGVGLKFVAINDQDCQRLAGLIERVQAGFEACGTSAASR
jgi:PilZ domain